MASLDTRRTESEFLTEMACHSKYLCKLLLASCGNKWDLLGPFLCTPHCLQLKPLFFISLSLSRKGIFEENREAVSPLKSILMTAILLLGGGARCKTQYQSPKYVLGSSCKDFEKGKCCISTPLRIASSKQQKQLLSTSLLKVRVWDSLKVIYSCSLVRDEEITSDEMRIRLQCIESLLYR